MPYITEKDKKYVEDVGHATSEGELNYLITKEVVKYLDYHGLSYSTINSILGALEGAKLEFYRRIAAPYENTKLAMNGDVYRFAVDDGHELQEQIDKGGQDA